MERYKKKFLDFLIKEKALTFGDFTTKSGRKSPYFFNTSVFSTGGTLMQLAEFYTEEIRHKKLTPDTVFGPAYKGIPLAVAVSAILENQCGRGINYTFDRKEEKTHGDKGIMVGHRLSKENHVVIVDDVITAGLSTSHSIELIQNKTGCRISAVIVAVDRKEKGENEISAAQSIQDKYGIPVYAVINIDEIIEALNKDNDISPETIKRMREYRERYGI